MKKPYWWAPKPGFRRSAAEILRYIADRIGHEDAYTVGGMTMFLLSPEQAGSKCKAGWHIDPEGQVGVPIYNRRFEYDGRQWDSYDVGNAVDVLFGPTKD